MCATMPSYAFAYFLPVILQEGMGYTPFMSQVLGAPPSVFAVIVCFALSWWADKLKMRAPFIMGQAVITIVGLVLTGYALENNGVRYFGSFLGVAGAAGNVPAILAYQSNNIRTNSKRAVGSALQVGFGRFFPHPFEYLILRSQIFTNIIILAGSIGGILASTVYRNQDRPQYVPGIWATLGAQFLMLILTGLMTMYFRNQNKNQEKKGKKLENCEGFRYTY